MASRRCRAAQATERHIRDGQDPGVAGQVLQQHRLSVGAPVSGIRQFGYLSTVPGMFCGGRSPAASASQTPTMMAGVRVRWA
jgi:hypothetical protein